MKALHSRMQHRSIVAAALIALSGVIVCPQASFAQAPPPAVTSADGKKYEAAEKLFNDGKYKEAAKAFEEFLTEFKMLSPRSLEAKYRLAICYIQLELHDDAGRHLREFIDDRRVTDTAKASARLLIAKLLTQKAMKLPSETEAQKTHQKKAFADAIKEYDAFITAYPRSPEISAAQFLRNIALVQSGEFNDALKGFAELSRRANPFQWEAAMWTGKAYFIQAGLLLEVKGGKAPKPEDIQKAMAHFDTATPIINDVYVRSGDVALQNEAVFIVAQMQLTRSQYVTAEDEEKRAKKEAALLGNALESFRAVRSVGEVVAEQDRKIQDIKTAIQGLPPGPDSQSRKAAFEAVLNYEQEKREKLSAGQDMFLSARLSIARIFLQLKQADEARTLIRFIQGQKELLEKDRDAQVSVAALLCLTYAEQRKADKAVETYRAFRENFKGNPAGENLPYVVATVLVGQDKADPVEQARQVEQIISEGKADYPDWRYAMECNQVLIAAAQKRGEYDKALSLCEKVLAEPLKPEVEARMRFLMGNVQKFIATEKKEPAMAVKAIETFRVLREKFPENPLSEDAWLSICQILAGSDRPKAIVEMEKFLAKFSEGGEKSENTRANLPIVQYMLGTAFNEVNQYDKAVAAWRKVIDTYPENAVAPGAFFKIFDIYFNEKKNYRDSLKLMEEFLQKHPKHENVYFAYVNVAELTFAGALDPKAGSGNAPALKTSVADIEAGARKLLEYLDYEKTAELKEKRGDAALIRIADRWLKELKLPPFSTLTPDQRATWQKAVDGVTASVERLLKDYPASERVSEALARLVVVQNARRRAQQADVPKIEAEFKDLAVKHGSTPLMKAKIGFALASVLQDVDPKKGFSIMDEVFRAVSEPVTKKDPDGGPDRLVPTFVPADWDRYLSGLFEAKRLNDLAKLAARVRAEYPLDEKANPGTASALVQEGQAVGIFWEAKVMIEQGKKPEAGAKFAELKKKFPNSTKKLEVDYGVILDEFERTGKTQSDYYDRLGSIISTQTGKGFELQARALFLVGRLQVADKEFDRAVGTFAKIQERFSSVPKVAADGLWQAAEIAEKQAKGELPVKTKRERKAANEARSAEAKPAPGGQDDKPAGTKAAEAPPALEKPPEKAGAPAAGAKK